MRKTKYPKIKIEIGEIYGDYLIKKKLGYDYEPKTHEFYWLVECIHCHKVFVKNNAHLKADQNSCACQLMSKGERHVRNLLIENNIEFYPQYIFPELTNRIFDFAILNDKRNVISCIEVDGFQHFYETPMCHDTLQERHQRDQEKNEFCYNHGIALFRIPYTDINDLTIDTLMSNKYLVKQQNA